MTVLYIIGAILLILCILLLSPITVKFKFDKEVYLKNEFLGICFFRIEPQKAAKNKKTTTVTDKKAEKTADKDTKKFFEKLKEKYGFTGAVKILFDFVHKILLPLKDFLKRIKVKKFKLKLVVAGEDAAATAVEYGMVCSAVYPVMALLEACVGIKAQNIYIRSNFESSESEFSVSFSLKIQVLLALIFAWKIYKEYKIFMSGLQLNERPDSKEINDERE